MSALLKNIRIATLATAALSVVCCGLYPAVVYGLAQFIFPRQANGSLIVDSSGTIRGSHLLGQSFTSDHYFHPRPSSAGSGYDAANSSGSNLGPTSKKLADAITQNVADYRAQNGLPTNQSVPADAVTSSGSGLDPHISPVNAALPVGRVAKARGLKSEQVEQLVRQYTEGPNWGVFGDPGVNVLKLNLGLDLLTPPPFPEAPKEPKQP